MTTTIILGDHGATNRRHRAASSAPLGCLMLPMSTVVDNTLEISILRIRIATALGRLGLPVIDPYQMRTQHLANLDDEQFAKLVRRLIAACSYSIVMADSDGCLAREMGLTQFVWPSYRLPANFSVEVEAEKDAALSILNWSWDKGGVIEPTVRVAYMQQAMQASAGYPSMPMGMVGGEGQDPVNTCNSAPKVDTRARVYDDDEADRMNLNGSHV